MNIKLFSLEPSPDQKIFLSLFSLISSADFRNLYKHLVTLLQRFNVNLYQNFNLYNYTKQRYLIFEWTCADIAEQKEIIHLENLILLNYVAKENCEILQEIFPPLSLYLR